MFEEQSMINRLSNPINRNRSAAKISKVMSSSVYRPAWSILYSTPTKKFLVQCRNSLRVYLPMEDRAMMIETHVTWKLTQIFAALGGQHRSRLYHSLIAMWPLQEGGTVVLRGCKVVEFRHAACGRLSLVERLLIKWGDIVVQAGLERDNSSTKEYKRCQGPERLHNLSNTGKPILGN